MPPVPDLLKRKEASLTSSATCEKHEIHVMNANCAMSVTYVQVAVLLIVIQIFVPEYHLHARGKVDHQPGYFEAWSILAAEIKKACAGLHSGRCWKPQML